MDKMGAKGTSLKWNKTKKEAACYLNNRISFVVNRQDVSDFIFIKDFLIGSTSNIADI